jgi:hypothetical protein
MRVFLGVTMHAGRYEVLLNGKPVDDWFCADTEQGAVWVERGAGSGMVVRRLTGEVVIRDAAARGEQGA